MGEGQQVMVELRQPRDDSASEAVSAAQRLSAVGFELDTEFEPVPIDPEPGAPDLDVERERLVLVRGVIDEDRIAELETQSNVHSVWRDTPIAPFGGGGEDRPR